MNPYENCTDDSRIETQIDDYDDAREQQDTDLLQQQQQLRCSEVRKHSVTWQWSTKNMHV
jgi:hypothetical protein